MTHTAPHSPDAASNPRWRRLPEERPRQIIDAAFAEFGEHGLSGARLDEIARRAGVSKGTIYLYFPSKDELFRAMVRDKVISVIEEAEATVERNATDHVSATEELSRYLTSHWEYARSEMYQTMYRLTHTELPHFPDLARFYGEEVISRSHRLTASIIARGIARGEFRNVDAMRTARAVAATFLTQSVFFERRRLFGIESTDTPEQVRDFLIDFALRALRPDPDAPCEGFPNSASPASQS